MCKWQIYNSLLIVGFLSYFLNFAWCQRGRCIYVCIPFGFVNFGIHKVAQLQAVHGRMKEYAEVLQQLEDSANDEPTEVAD